MSNAQDRLAPIALFAYNRPWHLRQTVEALLENKEAVQSDLIVFSDGPRNSQAATAVEEVRHYIGTITGFGSVTVVERPRNFGLSKSIVDGVTTVCQRYKRVIVLEDDLVISRHFLAYMNDGLNFYESEEQVASIHGYTYPVNRVLPSTFFLRGSDCLGWATWERAWRQFQPDGKKLLEELQLARLTDQFDLNGAYSFTQMLKDQIAGRNDSWAVRWHASTFLENKLTLYPGRSLVKHIGSDGSGTNCGDNSMLDTEPSEQPVTVGGIKIEENFGARLAIRAYFDAHKASPVRRALRRMKVFLRRWRN